MLRRLISLNYGQSRNCKNKFIEVFLFSVFHNGALQDALLLFIVGLCYALQQATANLQKIVS
jgi:hypothetical protein